VKVSPAFKRLEASLATEEKKDVKLTSSNSVTKLTGSTDSKGAASSTEEKPAVSVETKVETGTVPQPQQQPPQAQPKRSGQSPANSRNNSTTALPKSNSSASINSNVVAPKHDDVVNRSVSHVRKMSTNSNGPASGAGIQREDSVNITDMEGKAANVSVQIKQIEDDIKVKSDQLKALKDQLTWQQEGILRAKERKQNRVSALIQNIEFRAEESPNQSPSSSAEFTGKIPNFIKRTHSAQKSKRIKFPKVEFVNGKMYNIAQVLKCQAIVRNHLVRKRSFRPEWVLQWADSQGASKMRKRNNALKEIITTERDFVGHLNKVMEVFVRPIQKLQLLTPFELFEIFSDIEVIAALNQILLTKLEDRYKEWPKVATFADIFKENAELFTLYYRYIRNFTTARTKQQEAEGKYPHYTQFLRNCYEKYTGGLDVYAYLIMPVQRIMRYELLLKALLDYTEETHVDYQNLRDAIAAVQKVNRYIDERKKIDEQMEVCEQRFKDLIAKGGGYEVLLTQGNYAQRRFVKEFQLEAIIDLSDTEKGKKSEAKPELMIFSDLILASNFMHKRATLNEAGQSIPLVWIDTEFNKRNQKVIETIAAAGYTLGNGFLLTGPETSWFVKASSQAQMKELAEEIAHALKIEVTEASTLREGFRLGCWRFVRPISGFYDGEWMAGDFHGQGVFTSPEGRVFDGYWDHTLKAGYGSITEPSKEDPTQLRNIKSGWINEHTKGIPITALDSEGANFWNQTSELTDRDLHLLTLNAQDVVYERHEKIIEQDKESGTLFLVIEGSVRIEKTTSDGNSIRLAVMGAGTLLGDSSVLPALRKATASVVADTTTKLKAVSLPLVFELFKSDSILCARFYKHLAVKLSRRLRSLNSGGQAPPKPAPPKGISSKLSSNALTQSDAQAARGSPRASGSMEQIVGKAKDKEKGQKKKEKEPETDAAVCEKFGLPAGEVFIKTTEVWVKQRGKRLGRLYISGHFVCFDFAVFGSHHKEAIPILKIVTLEKDKEDNTAFKIKTKNKKFTFNIEANPLDDYYNLINSLWEQAKSTEETKALEERSVTKPSLNKKFTYQELGAQSISLSTSGSSDLLPSAKSTANFGVGKTWDKLDMQEEDWNLILQGSKTINYRSGAVIIQAGTVPQRVFQIVQGKCRLEKKMPDGSVQSIGSLNTGAMFGEMSFLEGETASISVVADAKVVVYVIEGYFLNILFVRYPNLAGRFFNYLSSVIATRVSKRESALRDESESDDSQSSEKFRRSTTRPIAANVFSQGPNSPVGAVQRADSKRKGSLTAINEQNAN
jgi:CRP-like cAMP-binding protein